MSNNRIDITALPPQQLLQFRKDLQAEADHFGTSLQALSIALSKYKDNIASLDQMSKNQDKQILVPLSASLYVPGKVKDSDKYLVDVGTGYFIEKTAQEAKVFYEGKTKQLGADYGQLEAIIAEKEQVLARVDGVLREKVQQQEQEQEQAAKQKAADQ
jgi:prefoldin alpha subunit